MKPYSCIESTVEFMLGDAKIRLWINEDTIEAEYPNKRIEGEAFEYVHLKKPTTKELIVYFIKEIPRLNAIQLIDKDGLGVVVYTVPFSEDVHG